MDPDQTFLRVHTRLSGMLSQLLTPRIRRALEYIHLGFAVALFGLLVVMHTNFVQQVSLGGWGGPEGRIYLHLSNSMPRGFCIIAGILRCFSHMSRVTWELGTAMGFIGTIISRFAFEIKWLICYKSFAMFGDHLWIFICNPSFLGI